MTDQRVEFNDYEPKPPTISAAQITQENYREVSDMIGASVVEMDLERGQITFSGGRLKEPMVGRFHDWLIRQPPRSPERFYIMPQDEFWTTQQIHIPSRYLYEHLEADGQRRREEEKLRLSRQVSENKKKSAR